MFVMFVRKAITLEHGGKLEVSTQCQADIELMFLGLIVFFIQVLTDLFEALTMMGWIYHIKTSKKLESLKYEVNGDGEVAFKHGVPRWYKLFWAVPIVLAKIALMGMVTLYGSVFIAQSETNLDVILNCVALCFVFELDDYAYQFFTSQVTKTVIDDMPDIVQTRNQGLQICDVFCGPCCIVIFIVAMTLQVADWVCLDNKIDTWIPFSNATDNTTYATRLVSNDPKSTGEFGPVPSLITALTVALATAVVHYSRDRD